MTWLLPDWWFPEIDGWIVGVGALCAIACAIPGCFLLLRRMSLMGDAISHAVLPGLALGFIVAESRSSVPMLLGAAAFGLLVAFLTHWISASGRVDRSAAMGISFTTLFAIGLILIVHGADAQGVDLDPGCVLYGSIEMVPLDVVAIGGWEVPRAALIVGTVAFVNIALCVIFFKELRIAAFDPALATAQGVNATLMHYLLMGMVAVTTVACFESIGSILVIAMLVVPAAIAHLLCDRLATMLVVACIVGALSAPLGHLTAIELPARFDLDSASTAGAMAVAVGALFVLALVAAPRHGLAMRSLHRFALALRIRQEDVLGALFRREEERPAPVARGPATGLAVMMLRLRGLIRRGSGGLRLTDSGRELASSLVRSHRLWETYLHDRLSLAPDHVHGTAHRVEHVTSPELTERLAAAVDEADVDPHGRPVPDRATNAQERPGPPASE